jgi:outer membrane protein TolC
MTIPFSPTLAFVVLTMASPAVAVQTTAPPAATAPAPSSSSTPVPSGATSAPAAAPEAMSPPAAASQNAPSQATETSAAQTAAAAGEPSTPAGPTLRLSMDDAVNMALDTSLGLKEERISLDLAAQDIVAARASFLPFVTSGLSHSSSSAAPQRFADGTSAISQSFLVSGSAGIRQSLPWFGGTYQTQWSARRNTTPLDSNSSFNPQLGSTFAVSFSQPLWQGLLIDNNRATLQRAERQRAITDIGLQQQIVATQASVRLAYLGLVAAIEGQKVAQENMDLAEQSLTNSQKRVAVGQAPRIDIITAQASVESNREQLILAEAQIGSAEDALRAQILDPDRPDYWTIHLQPTDTIQLTPRDMDADTIDAAIHNALASRLDLITLKRQMEITDLNVRLSRTMTKPEVDLGVDYSATGTGGVQYSNGVVSATRGFGAVLSDAFGGTYPGWTVGVSIGYPLGKSAAQASLAQGELQKRQQQLQERQLELNVISSVRQAARDVRTSYQRVQATQAALSASERQLDAEERRFAVGLSDTFTLQQRQLQLASARISELNARIAYNTALIEFDRVQKIQ